MLAEARATATMATGDLLSRLADALDDLTASRSASLLAGNSVGVVRAAAAEVRAIETLLTRLGVDDTELAREYAQAEAMARAVGTVAQRDPDGFGAAIVAELRRRNLTDAAAAVQRVADQALSTHTTTA